MPARSLKVPFDWFLEQNLRHSRIVAALPGLDPALQKALAELVLIRLFDDLQESIAGMAYRVACGTPYVDGTSPGLLTSPARSADGARLLFQSHGRGGKTRFVKWSKSKYIKDTVRHVISPTDPLLVACDAHSLVISEMQIIRNRIAHRNSSTRKTFNTVLTRYYGGTPTNVTPGLLLLAPRVSPPPLHQYLAASRVIVKDCCRA